MFLKLLFHLFLFKINDNETQIGRIILYGKTKIIKIMCIKLKNKYFIFVDVF